MGIEASVTRLTMLSNAGVFVQPGTYWSGPEIVGLMTDEWFGAVRSQLVSLSTATFRPIGERNRRSLLYVFTQPSHVPIGQSDAPM
jgi:hypothetical protein